jgi:hypothetical protein
MFPAASASPDGKMAVEKEQLRTAGGAASVTAASVTKGYPKRHTRCAALVRVDQIEGERGSK